MAPQKRADNWIDGLRGVAALTVVTYHLCSCFANWLNSPAISENGSVYLFQYPFLRLVVAGRLAVALFFIITGYVNSFNSRKQIRNGDFTFALSRLARTVLMVWFVCQLNGFQIASQVDSGWIRGSGTPTPGPTFCNAINGLLRNLILFWHNGVSEYDHTYWTIPFFLKGSMLVYVTLLGTTYTQPKYTKLILIFLYLFAWSGGQALMEMNIYAGMFLAELNADYRTNASSLISWPLSTLMMLFGLFLASFPDENPSWMPWSRAVDAVGQSLIPNGGELNRHVVSLGTTIFVFGVFFSSHARRLLAHPFMNFIGRISFPIYLLHNTLIRTVLSWVLYRQSIPNDDPPTYTPTGHWKADLLAAILNVISAATDLSIRIFDYLKIQTDVAKLSDDKKRFEEQRQQAGTSDADPDDLRATIDALETDWDGPLRP
ncbi:hypothetical protein PENDEC_c014G06124 [Penicillium decumbens]|uniref:Acyltransferase 3 domain-containing protein n=1 Tax=Penicillium decumbens TaxID=69771 RepID=A0A1V6P9C8_PENDC|nr:hypothetical protein PENDEC_c014G06124 [Penicillium decumbens]